jgi:hypothetical protein
MEDLWKVACLDYRIAAIAEQRDYAEIVRRYHVEETGNEHKALPGASARCKTLSDK